MGPFDADQARRLAYTAVDLNAGRALAWISYWNYGDYNPISHHLCAFPSAVPVQGFEFVNSTQGGKNFLIYGPPATSKRLPKGSIFTAFDMTAAKWSCWKTFPKQQAWPRCPRDHRPQDCGTVFRYRRAKGHRGLFRSPDVAGHRCPQIRLGAQRPKPGHGLEERRRSQISKIYPDPATGKFDYLGTKGQKIEWEMVPMGELYVEKRQFPAMIPIISAAPTALSERPEYLAGRRLR